MSALAGWALMVWMIVLAGSFLVGGYFMFRKFLKSMPREDGKSALDWQDYYIEKTLHLWTEEGKQLLNELVSPVPKLFRDAAKRTIAGKIGELALKEKVQSIDQDLILRGYILATPKRDHKWLKKHLERMQIDISRYQELLK